VNSPLRYLRVCDDKNCVLEQIFITYSSKTYFAKTG
jgi:hypothetical protein